MSRQVPWRIISWNLRYDRGQDKANSIADRLPLIRQVIAEEQADVIGFQEVLPHTLEVLEETFPEYLFIGRPRDPEMEDEICCAAIRMASVRVLDGSTVWLSPEPEVPGTRYPGQSICPRTRARFLLQHRESREVIWYINTHFDHESDEARRSAQQQLITEMAELRKNPQTGRVIWGGDLNYTPSDALYTELLDAGFADLSAASGGTFHDFGKQDPAEKIDYIFGYADQWELIGEARSLTFREGDTWLSDHYPVAAEVRSLI